MNVDAGQAHLLRALFRLVHVLSMHRRYVAVRTDFLAEFRCEARPTRAVHSRRRDLQLTCRFSHRETFDSPEFPRRDRTRRTTEPLAFSSRPGKARMDAFSEAFAFELGDDREQLRLQPS